MGVTTGMKICISTVHLFVNLQVQVQERDKLEREEQRYWKEYSKYKRELLMAEDDFRSLDCQVGYRDNSNSGALNHRGGIHQRLIIFYWYTQPSMLNPSFCAHLTVSISSWSCPGVNFINCFAPYDQLLCHKKLLKSWVYCANCEKV